VVACDLLPLAPVRGVAIVRGDFLRPTVQLEVRQRLLGLGTKQIRRHTDLLMALSASGAAAGGAEEEAARAAARTQLQTHLDALQKHALADVVLSDLAHHFHGGSHIDHTLQMKLSWSALLFASPPPPLDEPTAAGRQDDDDENEDGDEEDEENDSGALAGGSAASRAARAQYGGVLSRDGHFLCKVRYGEEYPVFLRSVRARFARVVEVKPPASRAESAEAYVLGIRHLDWRRNRRVAVLEGGGAGAVDGSPLRRVFEEEALHLQQHGLMRAPMA
jgi:23S rRNA U2552 (ribose-2'-O)-methylase RlmE/FtsJ